VNWPPILHHSLTQDFWEHADVNDLIAAFNQYSPRDFPLEINGREDGLCFAPFFCAHVWLGCSFERLNELLEPNWGQFITIPGLHKFRNSLTRSSSSDHQPVFWIIDGGVGKGLEETRPSNTLNPETSRKEQKYNINERISPPIPHLHVQLNKSKLKLDFSSDLEQNPFQFYFFYLSKGNSTSLSK
jgi:hypothetical protein